MKSLLKTFIILLFAVVIILEGICTVPAQTNSGISVLSDNVTEKTLTFWFKDNQANCNVVVRGKSGTIKISGTIKLYDETAEKNVQSWTDTKNGRLFSLSGVTSVKSGHTYKLSFSGTVYGANGEEEKINVSTTKSN